MSRTRSPICSSGGVTTSPRYTVTASDTSASRPSTCVNRLPVPTTSAPDRGAALIGSCLLQQGAESQHSQCDVHHAEDRQQHHPPPAVAGGGPERDLPRLGGA